MEKVTEPNMKLRSAIYGKFKNETEFAAAIGWSRQKVNKMTNGQYEPDLNEVNDIAKALEMDFYETANLFLLK